MLATHIPVSFLSSLAISLTVMFPPFSEVMFVAAGASGGRGENGRAVAVNRDSKV